MSYRDLEELLAERGIEVDHGTLYRWVQRFTPFLIDAARPTRHLAGDRWFVDETFVKVSGVCGRYAGSIVQGVENCVGCASAGAPTAVGAPVPANRAASRSRVDGVDRRPGRWEMQSSLVLAEGLETDDNMPVRR